MKSFKQYLNEKWEREGKSAQYRDSWSHEARVDDHDVTVSCVRYPYQGSNAPHEIAYTVNGSYGKDSARTQSGSETKIMKHVYNKVNQFMRHRKPEGVQFRSHDPNKINLHAYLSKHLSKRYNGIATSAEDNHGDIEHTIRFKK